MTIITIALVESMPAIALVESMPDCHRDSHRGAGNWDSYPSNGSERTWLPKADADELVAEDDDGYDRIVCERAIEVNEAQEGMLREALINGGQVRGQLQCTDLCLYDDVDECYKLTEMGFAVASSL